MAYDTGWISIVDLELGSSVANKLDVAFGNIDTALDALESLETTVGNHTQDIAQNAQDIATNTQAISDNTTAISDHETRISALEATQSAQYEFTKVQDMLITADTYQPVGSVTINQLNVGIFEYKISVLFTYNSTSTSAYFRYAIIRNDDATPVWYEVPTEPKDATNVNPFIVGFPIEELNGDKVEFALEARCETTGHQLDIKFADIIIDQKR